MCIYCPQNNVNSLELRFRNQLTCHANFMQKIQNSKNGYGRLQRYQGVVWDFGCPPILDFPDYQLLLAVLQCKRCRIRLLYHQLVVKELRVDHKPHGKRYFHDLARLIEAALLGIRKNSRTTSNLSPWCCSDHPRQIFTIFSIHNPHHATSKAFKALHPYGTLQLFDHWDTDDFDEDDDETENILLDLHFSMTHSPIHDSVPIEQRFFSATFCQPPESLFNITCAVDSILIYTRSESPALVEANKRWNAFYGSGPLEPRNSGKVHFPDPEHLAKIQLLCKYEVANRLLRADKSWLRASLLRRHNKTDMHDQPKKRKRRRRKGKKNANPPPPNSD